MANYPLLSVAYLLMAKTNLENVIALLMIALSTTPAPSIRQLIIYTVPIGPIASLWRRFNHGYRQGSLVEGSHYGPAQA